MKQLRLSRVGRVSRALLVALLFASGATATATPVKLPAGVAPAPLSPRERAGAELALAYLHGGAAAWSERLAPGSALAKLSKTEAAAELMVRLGPPEHAHWQLLRSGPGAPDGAVSFAIDLPSGVDDLVLLQLDDTGRVQSLRSLSDPVSLPLPSSADYDNIALLGDGTPAPPSRPGAPLALWGAAAVALLALGGASNARTAIAFAGLAALLAGGLGCGAHRQAASRLAAADVERLGSLAPLRAALGRGASPAELAPLIAAVPRSGAVADVARAWRADAFARQFRLNEAQSLLSSFPSPSPYPFVELLRARLSVVRGDVEESLRFYERVRASGFDDDAVRIEGAGALSAVGGDAKADTAYSRLTSMGTRLADPYYAAAEHAEADAREDDAKAYFRAGWAQQPLSREELFSSPLLASICTHEDLFALFDFGSAREPRLGRAATDRTQPVRVPDGGKASVLGELLEVSFGDTELSVPGGAVLAPADAEIVSAADFAQRERSAAVASLSQLETEASAPGALSHPTIRRRAELAAIGLAEAERWPDLLQLTSSLGSGGDRMPPYLARLRAVALTRSGRDEEAFQLLLHLAAQDKTQGRRDAGTLYQLAGVLVKRQQYDLALKVLRHADAMGHLQAGQARIRQVEMEKRLAEANETLTTAHFRVRYPKATDPEYARQLSVVLESERTRLQRWIPTVQGAKLIDVDLYPAREFLASYAQDMPVVGIFDGRMRVPFADLGSLAPELVAILSHELAHAMVDQATAGNAPKWLQEGIAEHVQMVQDFVNPIPDLQRKNRVLALSVVEAALGGFSEPQFVEVSYGQAAWLVHYLEAAHGATGIQRLLHSLGGGARMDAALPAALGASAEQVDAGFRQWATTRAPSAWPTEVRRYDSEAERELILSKRTDAVPAHVAAPAAFRPADARKDAITAWYGRYMQAAQGLRAVIADSVRLLRQGAALDRQAICSRLQGEAAHAASALASVPAPDPSIQRALAGFLNGSREAGSACLAGEDAVARAKLGRAEMAYNDLGVILAPYGLNP